MPGRVKCCLCFKRVETNKPRVRIGSDSVWPLFQIHVQRTGLEEDAFSLADFICMKCYGMISHHRMSDRGPNKIVKIPKPIDPEVLITKNVLRGAARNKNENMEANHQSGETSEPQVQSPERRSTTLESLDDNLNVQNETALVNTLIDQSICLVNSDSAGRIGTQEFSINEPVDEDVSLFQEDNVRSSPLRNESNSPFDCNVGSGEANVEALYDPYLPAVESLEHEKSLSEDHSVLVSLQIEFLDNNGNVERSSYEHDASDDDFQFNYPSSTLEMTDNENSIILNDADLIKLNLQGVKSTESQCFVCKSKTGRSSVPWPAIQQVWSELKIYIPKSNRTCKEHVDDSKRFKKEALKIIKATEPRIAVKNDQFVRWLHEISNLPQSRPCNLENDGIEPEQYEMFFGIKKEFFDELVQYLSGMRNTDARSLRSALGMFLMLLRNNMKQELIAFNFSTTQQVVSQAIDSVSIALSNDFVPKYLGYHHITRDEALQKHSIKLTSNVLNKSEDCLCLIADGTYNYIEKPADHELQRKTFSAHKQRNLLKPLYVVLPDGYILEAAGPYFCDAKNNDAANIRHHYKNSDILLFLEEDDFFVFDRGYRDVVEETEAQGFDVFMPKLLKGKRTHFECSEANSSRKVTMNRWVVESVNGRVKNVFPFFKHTIEGTYVPKIMRFNRIACAIINAFFPPLFRNKEFHVVISDVVKAHNTTTNELKAEIESLGIQRMTTRWERASESTVIDFPKLTMDDLKRITLGSYQIKMAERYIIQHMKNGSDFVIYVHRQNDEIIRTKIQSRFSKSKVHNAWVKFDKNQNGHSSITGLYCSCKVGERTLGCCSHLTAVLRYFGYDRHQPVRVVSRTRSAWDAIDCAEHHCDGEASDGEGDESNGEGDESNGEGDESNGEEEVSDSEGEESDGEGE